MNKTAALLGIIAMVCVAFIVGGFLAIFAPEGFLTFTGFVGSSLILVTGFAITFYSLTKTNEKVETVQKQTNGTLSKKDDEIRMLTMLLIEKGHAESIPDLVKEDIKNG